MKLYAGDTFHDEHYTRTSRHPINCDGVEWKSYRISINTYALISQCGYGIVQRNYEASTYRARTIKSGTVVRFARSETKAVEAATKALKNEASSHQTRS
mgnify:CR=1 FL=1